MLDVSPHTLRHYATVASRAARMAGALVATRLGKAKRVETKRSAVDLVTELDRASERLIHAILHRTDPTIGFLGEERGARRPHRPDRWIVDPIDGTSNFVHGLPWFGVSIGLEHQGTLIVGVIYDPMREELFVGTRGGGAFLNGRRIHASPTARLAQSLLSTGFSATGRRQRQPFHWLQAFERRSHGVRRMGSTVLSLASVASGRLDGFYERDLHAWDIAAGILLVQEAGGQVSSLDGGEADVERGGLVASNGFIHDSIVRVLQQSGRTSRSSSGSHQASRRS